MPVKIHPQAMAMEAEPIRSAPTIVNYATQHVRMDAVKNLPPRRGAKALHVRFFTVACAWKRCCLQLVSHCGMARAILSYVGRTAHTQLIATQYPNTLKKPAVSFMGVKNVLLTFATCTAHISVFFRIQASLAYEPLWYCFDIATFARTASHSNGSP
jgi:hypothetical protein